MAHLAHRLDLKEKKKFLIQFGNTTISPINNQKKVQTSLSLCCLILKLEMGSAYKLPTKTHMPVHRHLQIEGCGTGFKRPLMN